MRLGQKHTEESKKKIGRPRNGMLNPMFGRKHSKKTKNKLSLQKRGKKNPFWGKKRDDSFREKVSESNTRHGLSHTRFWNIWTGIRKRCQNKNSSNYSYYGGRGIKVCERWQQFENFLEDMGDSYNRHVTGFGESQTTIDRIDVDGDYHPGNCRWANKKEQRANQHKI